LRKLPQASRSPQRARIWDDACLRCVCQTPPGGPDGVFPASRPSGGVVSRVALGLPGHPPKRVVPRSPPRGVLRDCSRPVPGSCRRDVSPLSGGFPNRNLFCCPYRPPPSATCSLKWPETFTGACGPFGAPPARTRLGRWRARYRRGAAFLRWGAFHCPRHFQRSVSSASVGLPTNEMAGNIHRRLWPLWATPSFVDSWKIGHP